MGSSSSSSSGCSVRRGIERICSQDSSESARCHAALQLMQPTAITEHAACAHADCTQYIVTVDLCATATQHHTQSNQVAVRRVAKCKAKALFKAALGSCLAPQMLCTNTVVATVSSVQVLRRQCFNIALRGLNDRLMLVKDVLLQALKEAALCKQLQHVAASRRVHGQAGAMTRSSRCKLLR
eukprot:3996-Heterococcus_DN1.PRE.3